MIRGVYLSPMTDDIDEVLKIRKDLFGIDRLEDDDWAIHIILYDEDGRDVATARILFGMDGDFNFEYFAVRPECRHKGYGRFIMHMLIDKAYISGAAFLTCHQDQSSEMMALGFGFEKKDAYYSLDIKKYYENRKCCHS